MKKHLRLLAWVLSLAMLCQVAPVAAFAAFAESGTDTSVSSIAVTAEKNIPADALEFNGNYYKFYDTAKLSGVTTWEDASEFCASLGGHLAIIRSEEENHFLYTEAHKSGYGNIYFGYVYSESTGWQWVDGSTGDYVNWHVNEPNYADGEKYGMFYKFYTDEKWNDGDFKDKTENGQTDAGGHAFICEWSDYVPPKPTKRTFDFTVDAYSFANSAGVFFNLEQMPIDVAKEITKTSKLNGSLFHLDYHYQLSDASWKRLTKGLDPISLAKMSIIRYDKWDGSCNGMSYTSFLRYHFPDNFPIENLEGTDEASSIHELPAPIYCASTGDFVNYYYLIQNHPIVKNFKTSRTKYCQDHPNDAVNSIVSHLRDNQLVLAAIPGHIIVLTSLLSESLDAYTIEAYDCNHGSNATQFILKKTSSSNHVDIAYENYTELEYYATVEDVDFIDPVNYFGLNNHTAVSEISTHSAEEEVQYSYISVPVNATTSIQSDSGYAEISNREIIKQTGIFQDAFLANTTCDASDSNTHSSVDLVFPTSSSYQKFTIALTSKEDYANIDLLLGDTLLSISCIDPISFIYDEATHIIDVTADNPTTVNLLFTQNTTSDTWPWHTWAIDTTDTTELHAKLDNDGLHLTGDGISGAVVATENAETEKTDTITLPAKAEGETTQEVTISSKKDDTTEDDKLTIDGSDSGNTDPTEPTNPTKPSTPAAPSSGSGDGDSGAGALLLVGGAAAAAAITAGVVLSMPVEVQGKAELADHTPLAGAKISLLKDGKVVEQTTADEAGAFSVKVKRGEYQLTAAYTNAEGQIIHQTINVKAPAKDLTVTF